MPDINTPKVQTDSWKSNNLVVIALIIFFWPVGFYFMFRYATWPIALKWTLLATFAFMFVIAVNKSNPSDRDELMTLKCTRQDGSTEILENRQFDPCEGKTTCSCQRI